MADIDLSGEFEKISDKAITATAELKAAKCEDQGSAGYGRGQGAREGDRSC